MPVTASMPACGVCGTTNKQLKQRNLRELLPFPGPIRIAPNDEEAKSLAAAQKDGHSLAYLCNKHYQANSKAVGALAEAAREAREAQVAQPRTRSRAAAAGPELAPDVTAHMARAQHRRGGAAAAPRGSAARELCALGPPPPPEPLADGGGGLRKSARRQNTSYADAVRTSELVTAAAAAGVASGRAAAVGGTAGGEDMAVSPDASPVSKQAAAAGVSPGGISPPAKRQRHADGGRTSARRGQLFAAAAPGQDSAGQVAADVSAGTSSEGGGESEEQSEEDDAVAAAAADAAAAAAAAHAKASRRLDTLKPHEMVAKARKNRRTIAGLRKALGRARQSAESMATLAATNLGGKLEAERQLAALLAQWHRDGSAVIAQARGMLRQQPPPVGPRSNGSRSVGRGDLFEKLALCIISGRLSLVCVFLLYLADAVTNLLYEKTSSWRWSWRVVLPLAAAWASGGGPSAVQVLFGRVPPPGMGHVPRTVADLGGTYNFPGPSNETLRAVSNKYQGIDLKQDYMHKLKCLISQLRSQLAELLANGEAGAADSAGGAAGSSGSSRRGRGGTGRGAPAGGGGGTDTASALLSLGNVLAAAKRNPQLGHITAGLNKSADAQAVPTATAVVYDTRLQEELVACGNALDALVLRALGEEYQAWDMPHLTCPARIQRMQVLHALLRSLVLPQLNHPRLAAKFASRNSKVMGVTTDLLFSMMANIEALLQLLAAVPAASRLAMLRALSTDDCENEFSVIVRGCGFKPLLQALLGYLSRVDFLTDLRRSYPEHGIVVPGSSKAHYTHHHAISQRDRSWNDGAWLRAESRLGSGVADRRDAAAAVAATVEDMAAAEASAQFTAYLARTVDSARGRLSLNHDPSIRSHHRNNNK